MSREFLPCVELETASPVMSSVIWLHGLGADGHDFEPIVPHLGLREDDKIRFIFPHAPKRAVTINMGLIMPAWYDVREADLRRDQDQEGIRRSADQVRSLLEREIARGVPARKIILAGFSQGGAIALHVALRYPEALAGLMALSCYLVFPESLESEMADENRAIPIFQAHGTMDPLVPLERGETTHDLLVSLGYQVEWKTYPMGHEVHPQEILDIGTWLRARVRAI